MDTAGLYRVIDRQLNAGLPADGLARLEQIIGDKRVVPPVPPLIPVSKSTWWKGVREGRFPPGIKVTPAVTVWRWSDIHMLLASLTPAEPWTPAQRHKRTIG